MKSSAFSITAFAISCAALAIALFRGEAPPPARPAAVPRIEARPEPAAAPQPLDLTRIEDDILRLKVHCYQQSENVEVISRFLLHANGVQNVYAEKPVRFTVENSVDLNDWRVDYPEIVKTEADGKSILRKKLLD